MRTIHRIIIQIKDYSSDSTKTPTTLKNTTESIVPDNIHFVIVK